MQTTDDRQLKEEIESARQRLARAESMIEMNERILFEEPKPDRSINPTDAVPLVLATGGAFFEHESRSARMAGGLGVAVSVADGDIDLQDAAGAGLVAGHWLGLTNPWTGTVTVAISGC